MIPTFNEAESVVTVLDRALAADPRVDVLVVDDGSPDGTAKLVMDR
ncbi:MAG: glycosyltransferase, partial [Actinomycetota bacterium]